MYLFFLHSVHVYATSCHALHTHKPLDFHNTFCHNAQMLDGHNEQGADITKNNQTYYSEIQFYFQNLWQKVILRLAPLNQCRPLRPLFPLGYRIKGGKTLNHGIPLWMKYKKGASNSTLFSYADLFWYCLLLGFWFLVHVLHKATYMLLQHYIILPNMHVQVVASSLSVSFTLSSE